MKQVVRGWMVVVLAVAALMGCKKEEEAPKKEAAPLVVPSDPNDVDSWKKYLSGVVKNNMSGVRSRPYVYFVPAGDTPEVQEQTQRQLEQVQDVVLRGVLPGNMLAFGGPDSAKVANLVADGFKDVRPNSMKGVKILVIAASGDEQRLRDVLAPGAGDFIFVATSP